MGIKGDKEVEMSFDETSVPGLRECGSEYETVRLSLLPTPIHELPRLSEELGCRVFCKRDDLTGFGFGGNKSRKLDFLIPYAKRLGADTLLAIGANQSNFCRMVAAFGSASNMEVHLVLGGGQPRTPTGNLLVDHLLGAHVHHIDSMDWDDWALEAKELEGQLKGSGKSVFRMPVGGSTAVGALGYVNAMNEIRRDEERLGVCFEALVHASSSGGTQAGLIVGKSLYGWKGRILGMGVAKTAQRLNDEILALAEEAGQLVGAEVERDDVYVDDSFRGDRYAARTEACEEAISLFARKCGLFLDRVYTGKAAAGLIDYARKGEFSKDGAVCFLHTGGNLEIFE